MKKIFLALLASLCIMLALTACETKSDSQIQYGFVDKAEGQELLMANTEYYDGLTENELQFKMQSKDATVEKYRDFARDQVMDFSEEQKTLISGYMDQLEGIIEEKGYQLPPLDEITFICTTMKEEPGAAAYTHGTQIYVLGDYVEQCSKDLEINAVSAGLVRSFLKTTFRDQHGSRGGESRMLTPCKGWTSLCVTKSVPPSTSGRPPFAISMAETKPNRESSFFAKSGQSCQTPAGGLHSRFT